jgi:hypothetical protein
MKMPAAAFLWGIVLVLPGFTDTASSERERQAEIVRQTEAQAEAWRPSRKDRACPNRRLRLFLCYTLRTGEQAQGPALLPRNWTLEHVLVEGSCV